MQEEWWYANDHNRNGPVAVEYLKELLSRQEISRSTLVWKQGMENWLPLADVAELNSGEPSLPPPTHQSIQREKIIATPLAGAWRRFFARFIDLWLIGVPTAVITLAILSAMSSSFARWAQQSSSDIALGWLYLPIILLVEACIYGVFRNTPGKALLGISLTRVDASGRPTFSQYLRRQVDVYWYALGTGFPLVTLFTMARQWGKVKSGRQTYYDQGAFNVKAKKIGAIRFTGAVAVVALLFFFMAFLGALGNADKGRHYAATWLNKSTGRSVTLPAGWTPSEQKNSDQRPIYLFAGPEYATQVMFAEEDVPADVTVQTYARLWRSAFSRDMKLQPDDATTEINGTPAIVITGAMTADANQKIIATFRKTGTHVWRTVIWKNGNLDPGGMAALTLQSILFRSVD